jgi:hypothetical protein
VANLICFNFKKWRNKKPKNHKIFHPAFFFHFLKKKIAKIRKIRKKFLIVIDTGLGETVIGPNSMVFNMTIPCGIVLKVESSPKFQKRLLLQAVLRRSWRGGRDGGK